MTATNPASTTATHHAGPRRTALVTGASSGIGAAFVEATAREASLRVINLDVRETQERAIQIYEDLGYRRWGTLPHYAWVEGRWVTGFYYTKDLDGEGEASDADPASGGR